MHSASAAISKLAPGHTGRILDYRRAFPDISLVRALLLSLMDVMSRQDP